MAGNTLGIRCFAGVEDQFLYLDLGRRYYSFREEKLNSLDEESIGDEELLIGPKVIVEWSK